MRLTIFLFILYIAILTAGCSGHAGRESTADGAHNTQFDKTISKADSLYNCMQFRDAYKLYLQLLSNKETEADSKKKLRVLNDLSITSELSGNKVEQSKWLNQLLDLAAQTNNDYYHSLALLTIGLNVFYEGNHEKGIKNVAEAVRLMAKTDREDADHLMHGHLIMLARLYGETKDYDNAQKTNERNLQLTMQGTRWGTARSQQLIDRRMALAKIAALQAKLGHFQRADSAYDAWKAIQYEGNHTRDYFIVDYMKRRGRYKEAIAIYNTLIERVRQQGDTLGEMMNTAKWGLAEAYRKMGNCKQAALLYEQVLEIQDTLKSRKAKNTAQELAAIYHAQEQQQTIMSQQAENTRQRYLLFCVLAILAGITALAVIVSRKNRIIKRKNRALTQQITEALKYKQTHPLPLPARDGSNDPQGEDSADGPSTHLHYREEPGDGTIDTLNDEQLFQQINKVIIDEKLFLDPKFERQTIMDRFHLSKERVGAAFSKGGKYPSLANYIQQLRLEHAAHLLANHPERSITQIAADSGFSSSTYFSSCFRQYYGIRPTDFRNESATATQK